MQHLVLQAPSLQHLANVKIVTTLWNQRDIYTQIPQSLSYSGRQLDFVIEDLAEWKAIEDKVKGKVWDLPLPEPCKKLLSTVIKPIGMELIAWCQYHSIYDFSFNYLSILLPQQLRWTMHGTVDYETTAELLVKDESLNIRQRYEIACVNCLEDDARQFIPFISEAGRLGYINLAIQDIWTHRVFLGYFTCTLSGTLDQWERIVRSLRWPPDDSSNRRLYELALNRGSRATCKYFLKKLNQHEMPALGCRQSPLCGTMYYSLVLNMPNQERVVYQLLQWPMQSLFLEAAMLVWSSMNNHGRDTMLVKIISKINQGFQDYDYSHLFLECWRLSTIEYRRHFLNDMNYLTRLFETKKVEFVIIVCNEAPLGLFKRLEELIIKKINRALKNERVNSDAASAIDCKIRAALMDCKIKAASNSSKDPEDEEKRMRSEYVGRLVDLMMENWQARLDSDYDSNSELSSLEDD